MENITLSALAAQTFQVVLDDQQCRITLYQRGRRMYLDLEVDSETVCRGGDMPEPGVRCPFPNPQLLGFAPFLGHARRRAAAVRQARNAVHTAVRLGR